VMGDRTAEGGCPYVFLVQLKSAGALLTT